LAADLADLADLLGALVRVLATPQGYSHR